MIYRKGNKSPGGVRKSLRGPFRRKIGDVPRFGNRNAPRALTTGGKIRNGVTSNGSGRHDGYHNHGYTTPATHCRQKKCSYPHVMGQQGFEVNAYGCTEVDQIVTICEEHVHNTPYSQPSIGSEHNHDSSGTPSMFPYHSNLHYGRHNHASDVEGADPYSFNAGFTTGAYKYNSQTGISNEIVHQDFEHMHHIDRGGEDNYLPENNGSVPQPHMGEHNHSGFQHHGRHGHRVNNNPNNPDMDPWDNRMHPTHTHHLGYQGTGLSHGTDPHPGESMYPGGKDGSHSHRRRVKPGIRPRPQVR